MTFTNRDAQDVADALTMVYLKLEAERTGEGHTVFQARSKELMQLTCAAAPAVTCAVLGLPVLPRQGE